MAPSAARSSRTSPGSSSAAGGALGPGATGSADTAGFAPTLVAASRAAGTAARSRLTGLTVAAASGADSKLAVKHSAAHHSPDPALMAHRPTRRAQGPRPPILPTV